MLKTTDLSSPTRSFRVSSYQGDADAGTPQRNGYARLQVGLVALALAISACGIEAVDPLIEDEVLPVTDGSCVGLCFGEDDKAALADVQTALQSCSPEDEASFDNDPAGLIISDIALGDTQADGTVEVIVVVGRTSPQGHYGYPGTRLAVETGGEVARALIDDAFGAQADEFAYGIEGCGEFSHSYWVRPDDNGEVALTATVTTDVGENDVSEVLFHYVAAQG